MRTLFRFTSWRAALANLPAPTLGLALLSPACQAADEEIPVYLDDLCAPGQFGVDVHNNDVLSGSTVPGHNSARPDARRRPMGAQVHRRHPFLTFEPRP